MGPTHRRPPGKPLRLQQALGETLGRHYADVHSMSVLCLRLGNVNQRRPVASCPGLRRLVQPARRGPGDRPRHRRPDQCPIRGGLRHSTTAGATATLLGPAPFWASPRRTAPKTTADVSVLIGPVVRLHAPSEPMRGRPRRSSPPCSGRGRPSPSRGRNPTP
jgi:hypothetical protein